MREEERLVRPLVARPQARDELGAVGDGGRERGLAKSELSG